MKRRSIEKEGNSFFSGVFSVPMLLFYTVEENPGKGLIQISIFPLKRLRHKTMWDFFLCARSSLAWCCMQGPYLFG